MSQLAFRFVSWSILLALSVNVVLAQGREGKADGQIIRIEIKGFKFGNGDPVSISVGDSVVWHNADPIAHSAIGSSPIVPFDTGTILPGADSVPITFLLPSPPDGFKYSCGFHNMSGVLKVAGVRALPPTQRPSRGEARHSGGGAPAHGHMSADEHSFVAVGQNPTGFFLSHVPLFNDPRHTYQVSLEAELESADARNAYIRYRQNEGDSKCIINPEHFVLTEIETAERKSFKATFNHDSFNAPITGLEDVKVNIKRIIQFRAFDAAAKYPPRLTYQLYGNDKEVYLDHQITQAPSFHSVVKLLEVPSYLSTELLAKGPFMSIPSKQLKLASVKEVKMAFLNNSTHILFAPPSGVIRPKDPLEGVDEIEVLFDGEKETRNIRIGKAIYFDIRILNK